MIFFWRGFGFLVPIIGLGMLIGLPLLVNLVFADDKYYYAHSWAKVLVVSLTALTIWVIGRRLNGRPGRVVVDKETQKEFELKTSHDFMFLKMEYWAVIMVVGIVFLVIAGK